MKKYFNKYIYLILITFLIGCNKKEKAPLLPSVAVTTTKVKKEDAPIFLDAIGHVKALISIDVRSRVEGELMQIFFKEGADVQKGDLLFSIDPRLYQAKLDQAKATYEENLANLSLAKDKLKRYTPLVKEEYISKLEYEQLKTNVDKFEAIVDQNLAEIENAQINLDYCQIYAPVTGKTGIIQIDKGNLIPKNNQTPLISINQLKPIYVIFSIPEKDLIKVQQYKKDNLVVYASFDELKDSKIIGKLNLLDNQVDKQTGMIKLRAIFENTNEKLWPGQYVNVRLILTIKKDALIIPYEAIQLTSEGPQVYVVKNDNTVEMRKVILSQREDENIIVEKGLLEGETIVIKGQLNLYPKAKVNIKESK